jgi:uncharacterized membrane protein YgcG
MRRDALMRAGIVGALACVVLAVYRDPAWWIPAWILAAVGLGLYFDRRRRRARRQADGGVGGNGGGSHSDGGGNGGGNGGGGGD